MLAALVVIIRVQSDSQTIQMYSMEEKRRDRYHGLNLCNSRTQHTKMKTEKREHNGNGVYNQRDAVSD